MLTLQPLEIYIITKLQNICNLIGREARNFGGFVLSTLILYLLTKKERLQIPWLKKR